MDKKYFKFPIKSSKIYFGIIYNANYIYLIRCHQSKCIMNNSKYYAFEIHIENKIYSY